jgi:acyl-CoA synthetase (AMP-forming)/AMP-acid ligase II/acyl carrier protein
MRETLLTLLEAGASRAPESRALLDIDERTISYKALLQNVLEQAKILVSHGIRRGDRVAWIMPNGPEAALAFLAISAVATAVPIRSTSSFEEVRTRLESTRARAAVMLNDMAFEASGAAESLHLPIVRLPAFTASPAIASGLTTGRMASADDASWVRPLPDDVAVILTTTDHSHPPRQVPLTHRNLVSAAQQVAASLDLQPTDSCLNLVPFDSMHGLIGCLLASLTRQAAVVCSPGFCAHRLGPWIVQLKPTWFSAVPAIYQAWTDQLLTTRERLQQHSLRLVRSCSTAMSPRLQKEIETVLQVPVIEAYSVSEAGHQITSNPLPPRLRKPGSVGLPTGTRVVIMDNEGGFLPAGQTGEIVVQGDGVTPGSSTEHDSHPRTFVQGWYRTGDLGRLDEDGYLFLSGRSQDVVHRGGDRIIPRDVETVLLAHPGVAEATCFPRPHPTLGEDLVAAVVLREGAAATENGIRTFAFDRLAPPKVPSRILILDQLPHGPSGKVQRQTLSQRLAHLFRARPLRPRDSIESLIADVWTDVLETSETGVNDNFFSLGGDSVRAARIVCRINDLFQLALPVTTLFRHPTVGQFTDELKRLAHPALLETISENVRDLEALSPQDVVDLLASSARPAGA